MDTNQVPKKKKKSTATRKRKPAAPAKSGGAIDDGFQEVTSLVPFVDSQQLTTQLGPVEVVHNPYANALKTKDSATFQFFRETMWSNDFSDINIEKFQKNYTENTWVYIAVSKTAQAAAQVPPMISRKDREGKPNSIIRQRDSGLNELLLNPNPFQSWYDFVEEAIVSFRLTGNCYVEKVYGDKSKLPTELYVLNPGRISIVPGKSYVKGYIYSINGKKLAFLPDEIIHTKEPHPLNDWYGLSPLTAARLSIETDSSAAEWNRTFLMQGVWPSGSLETPADYDEETVKRLRAEIKESMQIGKNQAGRLMLLTGGLKFNKMAIMPKDADWMNMRRMSRDEILAIFGVPFAVAGLFSTEQTTARSAGVVQQVKNFYIFTIFPLLKKFYSGLTRDLAQEFHPQYSIIPDFRSVPALQEDVDQELTRAAAYRTLVNSAWSPNAALAQLYPHVAPFAWGDAAWMNAAMVPIIDATNPYYNSGAKAVIDNTIEKAWDKLRDRVKERKELLASSVLNTIK